MPLRFPVCQACAYGPLVLNQQLSPRQEVSQHKESPPFLASPGVGLLALAFRHNQTDQG